jgi:DNA repair protein RecO (recombination protein O)
LNAMAQYTTEGIVIGGSKLGEADRILRILTRDRGKISAVAKGVRKGKSKFSGSLEPMMVNSFLLAEGRSLDIVCQAENIRCYSNINSDYSLICCAGNLLEAAGKLTEEGLRDETTYEFLLAALDSLEDGLNPQIVELVFKTRMLMEHGIFPNLAGCNTCGRASSQKIHFDGTEMAFICDSCAKEQGKYHPVNITALECLYMASGADTQAIEEIKPGDAEKGVRLADEMLSAFLQSGVGTLGRNNDNRG